jgi:hypothetical protein
MDGLWACPWIGGTASEQACLMRYADTGEPVFEAYDGSNGTWGRSNSNLREVPPEWSQRSVVMAEPDASARGQAPESVEDSSPWWKFWSKDRR